MSTVRLFTENDEGNEKENVFFEKISDIHWACHRFVRDRIFQPIWYRIFGHKFHVIRTGLPPSPWYDSDIRILYGVMEVVKWFVENDMRINTQEEFEEELERIKKEESSEYREDHIASWTEQWEKDQRIIAIAEWWKNYPSREKEINDALGAWHNHRTNICKEKYPNYKTYHVLRFLNLPSKMTEEERREDERLSKIHEDLESKLETEETEMLIEAIRLRGRMWS